CLHEFLKRRNYPLPASFPFVIDAETVVYLTASVETEHHVAHFPVCKIDDIVIDEHVVGSQGESEFFVFTVLYASGICNKPLHHIKIHERLSAEKVYLKVLSCS